MKYLLFVGTPKDLELGAEDRAAMQEGVMAWIREMEGRGVRLDGHSLVEGDEAATVRVRNGEQVVSAGPFAETREQVGGFDILECRDLDEAIEVASKHPVAKVGFVEVRAFWQG